MKSKIEFHTCSLLFSLSIAFIAAMSLHPKSSEAATWSTPVAISPAMASSTPNAFASDPNGNQVWATVATVTGGVAVQVSQRPAGGSWTALANISPVVASASNVDVAVGANGGAAAAWSTSAGVSVALRLQGVWQSSTSFALTGSISGVHVKVDASGNGVVVWTRITSTAAVIEAVTFTSSSFSTVAQLSPSTHPSFQPQVAINDAGTAVVVWQAAGLLDGSNPYQVESVTRPAGGAWSAVTTASPSIPQTWTPQVAVDAAGNATVVWEQGATINQYLIYSATRPAGGAWSSPVKIESATWYYAARNAVATDPAGNVTAAWLGEDSSGANSIRVATRPAGGSWQAAITVGPCLTSTSLCSTPRIAASADSSITIVGWGAYGIANAPNVAVRGGSGAWTRTVLNSNAGAQNVYPMASNNAHGSAVWPEPTTGRNRVLLKQSDYQ
jgi:hypothetical protein